MARGSIYTLAARATTDHLLAVVAGEDAAAAYQAIGRLRPLLDGTVDGELSELASARLAALGELHRRLVEEPRGTGARIDSPHAAAELFAHLAALDHEEFHVACVNAKHVVLAVEAVAVGGLTTVEVTPARVFRPALRHHAAAVVVAHCHPSGDPQPSADDRALTRRLEQAGEAIGIPVLDHIVVGAEGRFYALSSDAELVRRARRRR